MNKKILVIVDMQKFFDPSSKTISNVCELIDYATQSNWLIINLRYRDLFEYECDSEKRRNVDVIEDWLKRYKKFDKDKVVDLWKSKDNGSDKIIDYLVRKELKEELVICGINYEACVNDTVLGLSKANIIKNKITVVERATDLSDVPSISLFRIDYEVMIGINIRKFKRVRSFRGFNFKKLFYS